MTDTFQLEIVTPEKMVVKDVAEEIQIPGKDGYLGILPGHAPLITELAVGEISYRNSGQTHYLSVAWGFAEVLPDKVTILAETAERPEEIDVKRAQESKRTRRGSPEDRQDRGRLHPRRRRPQAGRNPAGSGGKEELTCSVPVVILNDAVNLNGRQAANDLCIPVLSPESFCRDQCCSCSSPTGTILVSVRNFL